MAESSRRRGGMRALNFGESCATWKKGRLTADYDGIKPRNYSIRKKIRRNIV